MIDSTISHYKILEKLGEGGMGIVYKAQDTKLNRTVALKFLPDRVNKDEPAKARFLQEAQAAAGLNHPNICTIYGVDEHEHQLFIAMEYVDGGTIREKLPFQKVNDAVTIAIQIGEALQEAHSKGIVHRDVKADNIMLTSKGQAKVMDFGLAKLKGALKLTRTSSTVGTLGYMAPEQIQGGEVDHRSDIFSFGVLLFEMLTGKLPFRGEHEAAMVYSIVNEEPQNIEQLVPEISPLVANLIQRCLEKDPGDRYQNSEDIVVELKRSQKKTTRVSKTIPIQSVENFSGIHAAVRRRRLIPWIVAALAVILVTAGILYLRADKLPQLNPHYTSKTLSLPFQQIGWSSMTEDGNQIVFPAAGENALWDIYIMHPESEEYRKVTNESQKYIEVASISPNGNYIGYTTHDGDKTMTRVISSAGGRSTLIIDAGYGMKWSPDSKRIGYHLFNQKTKKQEIWSARPDGGNKKLEFEDSKGVLPNSQFSLAWSPDGNSIAWIRAFNGYREVVVRDLKTGTELQLTNDKEMIDEVNWTNQGYIVYSSNKTGNTNLWMVPARGGESIPITSGGGPDIGSAISNDGRRFLYYRIDFTSDVWLEDLGTGHRERITNGEGGHRNLRISPDGKRIAVSMRDRDFLNHGSQLYLIEIRNKSRRRLSFEAEAGSHSEGASWSPDGNRIAYVLTKESSPDSAAIIVVDVLNPQPRKIYEGERAFWADNENILCFSKQGTISFSLSKSIAKPFFEDSTWALPVLGGTQMLYEDLRQAKNGLWIVQQPGSSHVPKLLLKPGEYLNPWVIDQYGKTLYYFKTRDEIWQIDLHSGSKAKLVSHEDLLVAFDVSPDRKTLIYTPRASDRHSSLIVVDNLFK